MPDLHGWISRKIDLTEQRAQQASAWGAAWYYDDGVHEIRDYGNGNTIARAYLAEYANHIVGQDPAAVLRRCAADRKILARHNVDPTKADWSEATACAGCGVYSDCDWPVTDNLNDCPELLDLADGYGLTDEELARLDRPTPPERPPLNSDVLTESLRTIYAAAVAAELLADTRRPPAPLERALDILGPHLRDQPLYRPTV